MAQVTFEQHLLLPEGEKRKIDYGIEYKIVLNVRYDRFIQCRLKMTTHKYLGCPVQHNKKMLFTLAETIFDVRTSFPFERSWYISPVARPMVVLIFCFAIISFISKVLL